MPLKVCRELACLLAILPLLLYDLRAPLQELVTASDASETGGGACATTGLTREGLRVLDGLRVSGDAAGRDEVGLFAAFDGIGGARHAFELLNIELALYATSEIDEAANRVVERAWPDARMLGSIRDIDEKVLMDLRGSAPELRVLFFVGGFPCQGMSALNVHRMALQDERSSLVWELARACRPLKKEWPGVRGD